jgi:phosphoglycolate phosphatase-like HAD superfamily hydrolase
MSHFSGPRHLIIFDVDGTLVDAHALDCGSFDYAFREVTGGGLPESMWTTFDEVTAQSVIHQALGKLRHDDVSEIKERIRDLFLAGLSAGHGSAPASISAFPGAIDLISGLKTSPSLRVAIATGCWRETAHFKLKSAGFDIADIPFACASDRYSRAEIILLAAERAGVPIEQTVYVGDGVWDLKATRQLGIPFIGVGRKIGALRNAGAQHTMEVLSSDGLAQVLGRIQEQGF